MPPTAISRRIQDAINSARNNDFERAAINFFPALDRTAKAAYPKLGKVGPRIEMFIDEHEGLITFIATKNSIIGCSYDGMTLAKAIYRFGRCPIAHEGELDPKLTFDPTKPFMLGSEQWNFNPSFMHALIISVILNPVNAKEKIDPELGVFLEGVNRNVNSLWGARDALLVTNEFSMIENLYRSIYK